MGCGASSDGPSKSTVEISEETFRIEIRKQETAQCLWGMSQLNILPNTLCVGFVRDEAKTRKALEVQESVEFGELERCELESHASVYRTVEINSDAELKQINALVDVPYRFDSLLFVGTSGSVLALDRATGALKWTNSLPGCGRGCCSIVCGATALFTASNGYVYALDPNSGALLWQVNLPARSEETSLISTSPLKGYVPSYYTGGTHGGPLRGLALPIASRNVLFAGIRGTV